MSNRDYQLIDVLEANAFYKDRLKYKHNTIDLLIAEAYLMRSETLTKRGYSLMKARAIKLLDAIIDRLISWGLQS